MKSRHHLRIAAAAAALLLATPTTPATANERIPRPAACATGAITAYVGDRDDNNEPQVTISGWMRQCAPLESAARFGFVHYFANAVLFPFPFVGDLGIQPREYAPDGAPTEFTVSTRSGAGGTVHSQHGPLVALCVARDRNTRIACVSVSQPDPAGMPVVAPMPVDDERLRMPPPPDLGAPPVVLPEPLPHCGNCI